ncbi:MAG: hypothetical protein AB7S74_07315 [Hyphomicrobium sp.]
MSTNEHPASILGLVSQLRQLWSDGNRAEQVLLDLKKTADSVPTQIELQAFEHEAKERATDLEDLLSRCAPQKPEEALVLATLAAVIAERISRGTEEGRRLNRLIAELRAYLVRHCGKSTAELGLDEIYGPMSGSWEMMASATRALLDTLESKATTATKAA